MRVQKPLLVFIFVCGVLSLAVTLASFNFSYKDPYIYDAMLLYRGWPLHWIVESWPTWNPQPYAVIHTFIFQPLNFLVDVFFWAVVFQLPSVTIVLLKRNSIQRD